MNSELACPTPTGKLHFGCIYTLCLWFFFGGSGDVRRINTRACAHIYIYTLEHNMGNWGRGGVDEISDVVDVKNKSDPILMELFAVRQRLEETRDVRFIEICL